MRDDERNTRVGDDAQDGDTAALPHAPSYVLVRATVNLASPTGDQPLPCGAEALVDATDPFIADCLRSLFLVPLPARRQHDRN
jgi:hypothetical protein